MLINIREFSKTDWYGWAGATRFKNGSEPLIYEQELNEGSTSLTIIGDANGITIYMTADVKEGTVELVWSWDTNLHNPIKAEGEMRAIIKEFNISKDSYAPDLSYALDHTDKWPFSFQEISF